MDRGDKREAIIRAALELVAEQGFHGAPMAMVAERADVAAGTIYRYFENKDILIHETYLCLEGRILSAITTDYPEGRPIRERFLHVCRRIIQYFLGSPMEFRFLEQFHNSPYGVEHRRDKLFGKKDKDLITELFEDGQQQQIIKDLPMSILCALTFGPLVNACRDHILQFIHLDETLIMHIAEACWDAVRR